MNDKMPLNREQRRHPGTAPKIFKDVIRIDLRSDGMPIVHTLTKQHLATIDVLQKSIKVLILALVRDKDIEEPKIWTPS